MRGAERIGDRMVDVADLGGTIAIGESTGHVAASHKCFERRRGAITRLARIGVAGMTQRPHLRTSPYQLGEPWGGNRSAAGDQRGWPVNARGCGRTLQRRRLGDDVDDDTRRALVVL